METQILRTYGHGCGEEGEVEMYGESNMEHILPYAK